MAKRRRRATQKAQISLASEQLEVVSPPEVAAGASAGPSLPAELLDMILVHFLDAWICKISAVLPCALTCKAWNTRATAYIYRTLHPRSFAVLRKLELTLRRKPWIARLVRKLAFPHLPHCAFDGFGKRIPHQAIWGMKATQDDRYIVTHSDWSVVDSDTPNVDLPTIGVKFSAILMRCANLEELHIPIYWYGIHMLEFIPDPCATSLSCLVLLGHCNNEWADPQEACTRFRNHDIKPLVFPNLKKLVLADFLLKHSFRLVERFVFCHAYPSLEDLQLHGFDDIALVPRLLMRLSATFEGLSLIPPPEFSYHCLPILRDVTHNIRRLSISCTQCPHGYALLESTFSNVTSITLRLVDGVNRLSLSSLPSSVQDVTLVHTTSRPGRGPLRVIRPIGASGIAREIFRFLENKPRSLDSIRLRWITVASDLKVWRIMSFCLSRHFQRLGVNFGVDLRLLARSDLPFHFVKPVLSIPDCALWC